MAVSPDRLFDRSLCWLDHLPHKRRVVSKARKLNHVIFYTPNPAFAGDSLHLGLRYGLLDAPHLWC